MAAYSFVIAALSSTGGQAQPFFGMLPFVFMILVFYFVAIRPMQTKQKKLESMVASLKPRDRVLITPGIFGTVVSIDEETSSLLVRIDDNTKIRVLKSAVAGLQDQGAETEKK